MSASLNDYVKAGAVSSLINYHANLGGRDSDWIQVEILAYREFRDATPDIVQRLVRMAKASAVAAALQNCLKKGECLATSIIPSAEKF
jgi:hypothetical protein